MTRSPRYAANCTFLFTERPLLDRPRAARDAGFDTIELWWPFASATPGDRELDELAESIRDSGVRLIGLNFFAGDLSGADAGVVSLPGREQEFRDNVDLAVAFGERVGVRGFNALYGNRVDGVAPERQDELAVENLSYAAAAAARIGATVLVEPLSGPKPYPLRTVSDVAAVVTGLRAAGHPNVGMLLDVFHLAMNGEDVEVAIRREISLISHVQVADAPGRGEPGTGRLPLPDLLGLLGELGYDGWTALEFVPSGGDTLRALEWLPRADRGAGSNERDERNAR